MSIIQLQCTNCKQEFSRDAKYLKRELKRTGSSYKPFCCRTCASDYRKKERIVAECCNCKRAVAKKACEIKKSKHLFCSKHCSAEFNNKTRVETGYTTKGKKKKVICKICHKKVIAAVHVQSDNFVCEQCRPTIVKQRKEKYKAVERKCLNCSNTVNGYKKYCDECRKKLAHENGIRLASKRKEIKRSKNEIMFAELCEAYFKKITVNQPIFNNWDSDVQVYDYKLAVHWNGRWHYVFCGGKHKLAQVQNRDKIKYGEVEKCGWTNYIIIDMGKANKQLVLDEFEKLKTYISKLNETH